MQPIQSKGRFKDVDLDDLKETQRKITLRIQKIRDDGSERVKNLKRELYYWTNEILYEKAKFLYRKSNDLESKMNKAIDILSAKSKRN
jgi:hypothetical protein